MQYYPKLVFATTDESPHQLIFFGGSTTELSTRHIIGHDTRLAEVNHKSPWSDQKR